MLQRNCSQVKSSNATQRRTKQQLARGDMGCRETTVGGDNQIFPKGHDDAKPGSECQNGRMAEWQNKVGVDTRYHDRMAGWARYRVTASRIASICGGVVQGRARSGHFIAFWLKSKSTRIPTCCARSRNAVVSVQLVLPQRPYVRSPARVRRHPRHPQARWCRTGVRPGHRSAHGRRTHPAATQPPTRQPPSSD